ncbi:mucin-22 [Bactrocera dorsalis]|uniref:Mucin-22 n=1 Tax=Bactrocera dorsalis TaxID=27457 RepID=A0A6I9V969_BACDO|nr:mucin-22 [Bactrocera dorsalis]
MQNIEVPPTTLTDDETLDLAEVEATTSSGHLQKTAAATPNDSASTSGKSLRVNRECVQSDPETRRKSKARSRFTSALRKLSGRKKYSVSKDTSTESSLAGGASCEIASAPETVLSSGGEDTGDTNATASPETKPKKKSKLAKRFLLGGLKKSKASGTKKSIDEDEEGDLVQGSQEEKEETHAEEADAIDDAHLLPDDELEEHKKRKVTISLSDTQRTAARESKEVEVGEKQLADETNVTAVTGAPSETDYLTPIEDKTQPSACESVGGGDAVQTSVTITEDKSAVASPTKSAPDQKQKKKKLKTKKSTLKEAAVTIIKTTATTSGSTAPTSTPKLTAATVQKTSTTRTTTITTDEKFVITQSTRDTPPSERAPAKPSRVVTTAQPPTVDPLTASTGAVRKGSTRAAATLNSPSPGREQSSTFGAVSIAAAVAGKRQRAKGGKSTTNQATSKSASTKAADTVGSSSEVTAKSSKEAETELMHTSANPLQRGHRFPKPSPTVLTSFGAKSEANTATSKASASATTSQSASHSNVTPKLATPTSITDDTTIEGTVTAIADVVTIEENHTKPTNATVALDAPTQKTDTSVATLEAIRKQIQFQLESHASIDKPLQQAAQAQRQEPRPHNQQHQVSVSPQLLVDDAASPPHSLQSNVSLSNYQQPPPYTPPHVPTVTSTPTETRSSSHFRHPSSSKVIFPDPGIYSDIYADKSAALLYIADESVTTASSSGADDVVSSAESAQPSDYSGNNLRNSNLPGHAFSDDFDQEEQSRGPPLQPTVRFAVGSVVRPLATSFDSPLHDHSSYDSNPSSDSHSESSRRRIRYISQPSTFDEDFERIQQHHQKLNYKRTAASDYSVDSEYDSGDNQMPAFGDLTMEQDIEPTIMTSANTEKREHLYKILVIGELGTGKTSFIKRYVHQFFSQNYRATIGVDFALKVLHWDPNTTVRLQLWDIAGQERFGNMTRVYYKEAVGAFIVFDVTRSGTFDCVSKWKEDLDSKVQLPDGSPIPCILLANKCDQEKQGIVTTPEKMDEYVRENGFAGWYETSAKENINIDEAARALVNKILLNDKLISAADLADSEKFNLNSSAEQSSTESKGKCSC